MKPTMRCASCEKLITLQEMNSGLCRCGPLLYEGEEYAGILCVKCSLAVMTEAPVEVPATKEMQ